MNVTKGIFQAVMMAKEAVDDPNRDPLRIESALNHLEFYRDQGRAAALMADVDEIRRNREYAKCSGE